MAKFVIRLDVELDRPDDDSVGEAVNRLIEAVDALAPEHYRWAFVPAPAGFEESDLEKDLAIGLYQ